MALHKFDDDGYVLQFHHSTTWNVVKGEDSPFWSLGRGCYWCPEQYRRAIDAPIQCTALCLVLKERITFWAAEKTTIPIVYHNSVIWYQWNNLHPLHCAMLIVHCWSCIVDCALRTYVRKRVWMQRPLLKKYVALRHQPYISILAYTLVSEYNWQKKNWRPTIHVLAPCDEGGYRTDWKRVTLAYLHQTRLKTRFAGKRYRVGQTLVLPTLKWSTRKGSNHVKTFVIVNTTCKKCLRWQGVTFRDPRVGLPQKRSN